MNHGRSDRAVILDLGNVVLDWNVERFLGLMNIEACERALLREELFEHPHWLELDHGRVSETEVIDLLCERTPLSRSIVEAALDTARRSLVPIEESAALMREIADSGIGMYCLSNMSRETWSHVRGLPLFEMFDGCVISAIEGCMKPEQEIFDLTLERFGLRPEATLFVDDSAANVETSRRLGIHGVHFRRSPACYEQIRSWLC